ncbi:unnamed protein product [Camellia sinensis]
MVMATVTLSSFSAVSLLLTPSQIGTNSIRFFFKPLLTSSSSSSSRSSIFKHTFAPKVLASSTAFVQTKPCLYGEEAVGNLINDHLHQKGVDSISDVKEVSTNKNILACPICYERLIWNGDPVLSVDSAPRCSLQCGTCKKAYFGNETHIDLTVASGAKEYGEAMPASTELFRVPLVSFLYERGWRQSFSVWGGFPGPQKEFELTKDFLKPVLGGNIVDASCGSGLFSRLFAKSGLFSLVVALDFSENMLKQCYEFINQEENFPKENFILVRADISRLPFASSSVDAVHAGAALHCWPSPSAARDDCFAQALFRRAMAKTRTHHGIVSFRGITVGVGIGSLTQQATIATTTTAATLPNTLSLPTPHSLILLRASGTTRRTRSPRLLNLPNSLRPNLRFADVAYRSSTVNSSPMVLQVAEISRVLRPGGVFVATTYILDGPFAVVPFLRPLRRNIGQFSGSHVFLAESELEDLCNACGLVGFTCNRNGQFVMISATKPS